MSDVWGHGDAAKVAQEAAEKVRELNHATLNAKGMSAPEISRTVRHLLDLVERLPQTFEQLRDHLAMQQSVGQVRMEDGRDSTGPVATVVAELARAAALCKAQDADRPGTPSGPLSHALHEASGWLYNMGSPWSDPDDED